jgi:hypothetical protein
MEMDDLKTRNVASSDKVEGIHRRHFLKGLGIVTATLTLAPQVVLADTDAEAQEWYDLVNNFIFTVANGSQAQAMATQLSQMKIYHQTWSRTSTHWAHATPFIFDGATISSQRVRCDNGFQLVKLPYYDNTCPCNDFTDLNVAEVKTVIHPNETKRWGCVMAPAGERVPFNNDHANYVERAAEKYPEINLNEWKVTAERPMVGRGRRRTGFHLTHKTKRAASGRVKTDFIISSDI